MAKFIAIAIDLSHIFTAFFIQSHTAVTVCHIPFHNASQARPIFIDSVICICRICAHDSWVFAFTTSQFFHRATPIAIKAVIAAIVIQTGADIPAIKVPTAVAAGIITVFQSVQSTAHNDFIAATDFIVAAIPNNKETSPAISPVTAHAMTVMVEVSLGLSCIHFVNDTSIGVTAL